MSFAPTFKSYVPPKPSSKKSGSGQGGGSKESKGNHASLHFESMRELGQYLAQSVPMTGAANHSKSNDSSFCPMSYQESVSICQAGGAWLKGAEHLQRLRIPPMGVTRQIETAIINSSPVGFAPNVGAYCANLPDSMLSLEDAPAPRPTLKIEVNATLSSSASPMQTYNRGRALLAVIKALESSGVSVSLDAYAFTRSKNGKTSIRVSVPVKRASEALSAPKLAFALCNAAFVRRVFFRCLECSPEAWSLSNNAYGYVADAPSGEADLHFGGLYDHTPTHYADEALEYILAPVLRFIHKLGAARK